MRSRWRWLAPAVLWLVAACTDTPVAVAPVVDAPQLEQDAGFDLFVRTVAPLLARSCGGAVEGEKYGCHVQPAASFEELGAGAHPEEMSFFVPVDEATGAITTPAQLRAAYDAMFGGRERKGVVQPRVDVRYPPRFSLMLRKPLSQTAGGLVHLGGDIFSGQTDPGYRALRDWIDLERGARESQPEPLEGGEAGRFFKEAVLPVLVTNSCMSPACHEFNHSNVRFDLGAASEDLSEPISARFTNSSANANRRSALGLITKQLYLTGDVSKSRFMAKALPLAKGGVLHKGGNDAFFDGPEDPDFKTLVRWAELERKALVARTTIAGQAVRPNDVGRVQGVLFVRRPIDQARRFLDPGRYMGGGDLWVLPVRPGETPATAAGPAFNLTARFHPDSDADIREPDVRYDGRAVLFAMRIGKDDALNIYELSLDDELQYVDGSLRRLTYGPTAVDGVRVHFTDPTWVPDPEDAEAATAGLELTRADVVFASNLAGEVAPAEEYGVLGEVDAATPDTIEDWERHEPDGAYVGRRLRVLAADGSARVRRITSWDNRTADQTPQPTRIGLDRPLKPAPEPGAHYVIERERGDRAEFLPAYSVYGVARSEPGEEQASYEKTLVRITHSPNHELDLSVRSTGEVFFASLRNTGYARHRPVFNVGRNRRQLDKAFSFPTHRGNRSRLRIYADYHELPGGNDIFAALAPDSVWGSGALHVADHQLGCMFEPGNPVDGAKWLWQGYGRSGVGDTPAHPRAVPVVSELFPRFGPAAITDHGFSPGGTYRDPRPMPDGSVLASYAAGPIVLSDPAARPDFDLVTVVPDHGLYGAPGGLGLPGVRVEPIPGAAGEGTAEVQAVPIMVRLKERIRGARRTAEDRYIRPAGHTADTRPATFCEKNYRVIDSFIEDNIPNGKHVTYERDPVTGKVVTPMDKVAFVRIVEGLAWTPEQVNGLDQRRIANRDAQSTRVSNGIHPAKRIIAEVALDETGGVCFPIPSDTPYVYQSLNSDRMALRGLKRWFFTSPNEYFATSVPHDLSFQQCAACHGSMTGRPQDTYGPMDHLTPGGCGAACHAERDRAAKAYEFDDQPVFEAVERVAVTFRDQVQPILDGHCVACHGSRTKAAGLDLSGTPTRYYSRGYETLMALNPSAGGNYDDKRYVSERQALAIESYLIEKLYGRELKARRALEGDVPHPSQALIDQASAAVTPLTDAQRLTIARWIDLGAVFRMPEP